MSATHRIVKNSIFGVAGEALSGALLFATLLVTARYLGIDRFGVFSYILALVGVFQLIADFGLTNIIVREISRDKSKAQHVIGSAKRLAWIFSLLTLAIIACLGYLFSHSKDELTATILMGVAVLSTFHSVIYGSVCRAFEEMGFNALGNVAHKILLFAFVVIAIQLDGGLVGVAIAHVIVNWAQWMFFYILVRVRYFQGRCRVKWNDCLYLLREAFPVGAAMVLRRATLHLDTLLLTAFSTTSSVGLFNAAYKIVQMVDMIPFTLAIPLYPPLSRLAAESQEKMFAALNNALRFFLLLAVPIASWLFFCAPRVTFWTFGAAYADAAEVLEILAVAVVFLFPTSLFIFSFSSLGKQKLYSVSVAICLGTNLLLDLILIPSFGAVGAAMGTLAAEIVFFLTGAWMLYRLGARMIYMEIFGKPVIAAAAASPILVWGVQTDGVLVLVGVSLAYLTVYALMCFVFRAIRWHEIVTLRAAFTPKSRGSRLAESMSGD